MLFGKVAYVTGGASGIGLAIAERFAADGASVAIADLARSKGAQLAKQITTKGSGKVIFVECDTTNEEQVESTVLETEQSLGPIDIAVCSAGRGHKPEMFHESSADTLRKVLDVNLIGPFLVGKAVTNRMLAAGRGGSIINISSVGAVLAVPETYGYMVSKAALSMLTKTQALALADKGIRVNAIGPGPTRTPMTDGFTDDTMSMILSRTPLGRLAEPSDIAGVAAFLAGPDSAYITGQTIFADGGRLVLNYLAGNKIERA
jgi:NAD(P)-dependent dehydrogenase (short-subunit alcohol dehydrogenase family)